jgi:hypothetical protein
MAKAAELRRLTHELTRRDGKVANHGIWVLSGESTHVGHVLLHSSAL